MKSVRRNILYKIAKCHDVIRGNKFHSSYKGIFLQTILTDNKITNLDHIVYTQLKLKLT